MQLRVLRSHRHTPQEIQANLNPSSFAAANATAEPSILIRSGFILLLALMFILPASAHAASLGDAGITQPVNNLGLVGYWPFEEGTGSTTADRSGRGNNGTLQNVMSWAKGKIGNALSFNGSTSYVSVPDNMSLDGSSFTLSAWVMSNNIATEQMVFSNTNVSIGWHVEIFQTKMIMQVYPSKAYTFSNVVLLSNQWQHLVVVYNNGSINYYVNGVAAGSASYSFTAPVGLTKRIGTWYDGTNTFNGSIDDVRIYNRALSASEVKALYNNQSANLGHANTVAVSNGLVGYWPLDGATTNWTTNTTRDISGNNNTGTLVLMSTSTSPVAGKLGGALNFDGINSYINAGAPSSLSMTGAMTLSVWIKSTGTGRRSILSNYNVAGNRAQYHLEIGTDNKIKIWADSGSTSGQSGSTVLTNGIWYHVVAIYNNNSTWSLYLNGIAETMSGASQSPPSVGFGNTTIGKTGDFNNFYFNGSIDDVRVYNRALSAAEVKQLYALGSANIAHSNASTGSAQAPLSAGLVGYWTFDGGATNWRTNTTADLSGSGNTGTLVNLGTTTAPVAGKIGQALKFNGSNSYIQLGATPFTDKSPRTVTAWIKTNTVSGNQIIFGEGNNSSFQLGATLYLRGSNDHIRWFGQSGGAGGSNVADSTTNFQAGKWYFIAGTYDAVTNKLYVNGVLETSTTISLPEASRNAANARIGQDPLVDGDYFNGTIDDVRIYNRALSTQEVQQLYLMGK